SILLIALGYLLIAKQESLNWLTIYGWFVLASGIIYLGLLLKNFFARKPGLYLNSAELFSFFCLPKRKKQRKGQAKANAPLLLTWLTHKLLNYSSFKFNGVSCFLLTRLLAPIQSPRLNDTADVCAYCRRYPDGPLSFQRQEFLPGPSGRRWQILQVTNQRESSTKNFFNKSVWLPRSA